MNGFGTLIPKSLASMEDSSSHIDPVVPLAPLPIPARSFTTISN